MKYEKFQFLKKGKKYSMMELRDNETRVHIMETETDVMERRIYHG
jgi:hypothetical protein